MKRSIISLLVAGLFAGTATVVFAADNTSDANVKAAPKQAETSQSRSSDPNTKDAMNDTSKDTKQDKTSPTAGDKSMQDRDKTEAAFKKADKDHDGTLDRKEAKKFNKNAAKNFDAIDADKDGTLSMEEIDTYMAAHPGKKGNM
jgi:hypothetical protein